MEHYTALPAGETQNLLHRRRPLQHRHRQGLHHGGSGMEETHNNISKCRNMAGTFFFSKYNSIYLQYNIFNLHPWNTTYYFLFLNRGIQFVLHFRSSRLMWCGRPVKILPNPATQLIFYSVRHKLSLSMFQV